jgi:hypothetical protein
MKKIVFAFLLFIGQFAYSQNSNSIDKINFSYIIGGSSWNNGVYSRQEIIELSKDKNGDFKISKHQKVVFTRKNEKRIKDTTVFKTKNYTIIPKNEIESLIKELNSNQENYTEAFLKKEFTKSTRKEILKVAKKTDNRNYFINSDDTKEEIDDKYLEIQEYKYLDKFLDNNKPFKNDAITIVVDAWNLLYIITTSEKETKKYRFQFFETPSGQPVSKSDDVTKVTENQVINLNVNLIIQKVLPKNSEINKVIDIDNIKTKYLYWFFENEYKYFKF